MLDTAIVLLQTQFGEFGSLLAVGGLGLILAALSLLVLVRRREDPLDKLREARRETAAPVDADRPQLRGSAGPDRLERYRSFLEPQDAERYSAARMKLVQAGCRGKGAVRTFHFAQFTPALGLLWVALKGATGTIGTQTAILGMLVPGLAGYMLPRYWVSRRRQIRQEEIVNGFPDALDMMLVCVEAGQSLDQAILRVAREIRAGYPALADEYEIVSHEMRAGKDRAQVLRDLGERAGVADVSSFVTVLIQSAAFGTPVTEALRIYAAEMRDKRVMRAEEKANTLPTKMTLATMMLTVPPLLIILIGPSIYDIATLLRASNF